MLRQVDPDREISRMNKEESLALLARGRDAWNATLWISARKALLFFGLGFQRQAHPALRLPLCCHTVRTASLGHSPQRSRQRDYPRHRPARHIRRAVLPPLPGRPQPFPDQVRRWRGFFSIHLTLISLRTIYSLYACAIAQRVIQSGDSRKAGDELWARIWKNSSRPQGAWR